MTQLKNKKQIISIREKTMEKLVISFRKITIKAKRIQQQILEEIETDFLFNDLTSQTQSYSF